MIANYLIVYKTEKITGSYFTNLTVDSNTTLDDWTKFSKDVKNYLVEVGLIREHDSVALLNIVKLNEED